MYIYGEEKGRERYKICTMCTIVTHYVYNLHIKRKKEEKKGNEKVQNICCRY